MKQSSSSPDQRTFLVTCVSLFALLLTYSLVQASIPGVNEPHYLTKSRHVWQPTWCEGDLFLESSNPHLVFYRTVGYLAAVLPFPLAALFGRVLAYGLLAFAWTRLACVLTGQSRVAIVSASVFLALATLGNWSGEWLVGGVESKVFAYGFGFWGTACLLEGRIPLAGLLVGLAVSFHPVVGAWLTLALATTVVLHCTAWAPLSDLAARKTRVWVVGGVLFVIAAWPGLWPALQMLGDGTPEQAIEATRYQVLKRLSHHLNPQDFPRLAYRGMGLLLVIWFLLRRGTTTHTAERLRGLDTAVLASVVFATVGVLVGQALPADGAVTLLKFYPFRLADVLVPLAVSLWAGRAVVWRFPTRSVWKIAAGVAVAAVLIPAHDRDSSQLDPDDKEHWGNVCYWLRTNTPPDAVVFAQGTNWALKWFAQRQEYVNYKDVPQDPTSIVEFKRRRRVLYDWSIEAMSDHHVTAEELTTLHDRTGITHFVSQTFGPIDVEPLVVKGPYRVYATRTQ